MGETITEEQVVAMIAEIMQSRGDDGTQHRLEDLMRLAVLRTIAAGVEPDLARRLAKLAASTYELDFTRWCT